MSTIKDINLDQRNTLFIPDEIHAAIICETDSNFMKDEALCKECATEIYNKQIKKQADEAWVKAYSNS
jgi:hypothetical protein